MIPKPSIRLAPLCGVTDHIFRSICYSMGCDLAYTEMISAMLPFGSIDETIRAAGSYIIRYQLKPALVLDVFYCYRLCFHCSYF